MPERINIRWDYEMCCYRVNKPNWDGGEVVDARDYDTETARLLAALEAAQAEVEKLEALLNA
jgi:hypothetical protein